MIPFGLTRQQFVKRYRAILDREGHRLIDELRQLLMRDVPDSVTAAEAEIFLDVEGEAAPTAGIYYDGKDKKVDHSDPAIFPGKVIELFIGISGLDQFDPRYFTQLDFGGMDMAADLVKAWFAECWWKAGGWTYSCPVRVAVHDDYGDGESILLTEKR